MPLTYIQFKSFEDFIRLVTFSPAPFIDHAEMDSHNVYFFQILGFGERILYYAELDKKIEEKYVVYNRFKDSVSFSSKLGSDGQSVYIPILEVARTNIFTEYPPK